MDTPSVDDTGSIPIPMPTTGPVPPPRTDSSSPPASMGPEHPEPSVGAAVPGISTTEPAVPGESVTDRDVEGGAADQGAGAGPEQEAVVSGPGGSNAGDESEGEGENGGKHSVHSKPNFSEKCTIIQDRRQ